MVVTTQEFDRDVFGLRVGAANVRRHFPKNMQVVELRLGDLRIQCQLPPTFWNGEPEIHDPRLCAWLKFKVLHEQERRKSVCLAMEQADGNTFTVQSEPSGQKRATRLTSAA